MNTNTDNSTDQPAWQHAGLLAVNFCGSDWTPLLGRLEVLDGDRIPQLTEAAARLRETDTAATASIGVCRSSVERYGAVSDEYQAQLDDAEAMLAVHGYLHPSHVRLLGTDAHEALEDRHGARNALIDLLLEARSVLDGAS